eukprot:SAG25_NODE_12546_length_278_cov_1.139665_1_plen_29_part_10
MATEGWHQLGTQPNLLQDCRSCSHTPREC